MKQMKIEVLEHARMTQTGSSLLELIQNVSMPTLDLLVREAIQNSLDAAQIGVTTVSVDFSIKKFRSDELSAHFDGIRESLNLSYAEKECEVIVVRDVNTVGLTGPLEEKDVVGGKFGHFQKLVYNISKKQESEGAGGSWGLGKTVYFRVGIGLVIFYSRVKSENGGYESRLAAVLCENEKMKNVLIPQTVGKIPTGIAFWGTATSDGKHTRPITCETEIRTLLNILSVPEYRNEETGTAVIIPYIDRDSLLSSVFPADREGSGKVKPYWFESVESYISLAISRWYFPRIGENPDNKRSALMASINQDVILPKERAIFNYFSIMYQKASSISKDCDLNIEGLGDLHLKIIKPRNLVSGQGQTHMGCLAFVKVNRRQMEMMPPNNYPSPFDFIGDYSDYGDFNPPIVCYTRKPGMIVGYETSGKWTMDIPKTGPDEFVLALFVLCRDERIIINPKIKLEEYIRKSEKADHSSWSDWGGCCCIEKIQRLVANTIAKTFPAETGSPVPNEPIGLGREFNWLLPPNDFGNKPSVAIPSEPNADPQVLKRGKSPNILIYHVDYIEDKIVAKYKLSFGQRSKVLIALQVASDGGAISAKKWESETTIGTSFPFELISFSIESDTNGVPILVLDRAVINSTNPMFECAELKLEMICTDKNKIPYAAKITCMMPRKDSAFTGEIIFSKGHCEFEALLSVIEGDEQ